MKQYIDCIQKFVKNIFLEENNSSSFSVPKELTEYYKAQLETCYLDVIIVARAYHEVEDIIEAYKYRSERWYASEIIWAIADMCTMSSYVSKFGENMSKFTIVPIPMHWTRYAFRGFDHVSKIASWLAKKLNISYSHCLSAKFSWRQSRLSREKRLENRKNRFSMSPRCTVPENIILIDDVISTGSTANECAKILKEMWAKKVIGIFFASSAS
jgi:competence protein ComFC